MDFANAFGQLMGHITNALSPRGEEGGERAEVAREIPVDATVFERMAGVLEEKNQSWDPISPARKVCGWIQGFRKGSDE